MDCGSEMRDRRRRRTLSLGRTILLMLFDLDIITSNRPIVKIGMYEVLQLQLYILSFSL